MADERRGEVVLAGGWGGQVLRTGPRRLEFDHGGAFLTIVLWAVAALSVPAAATVGLVVLYTSRALGGSSAQPFVAAGMPLALGAILAFAAWSRTRQLGRFVLDADAAVLERHRRAGPERWPFSALQAIETRMDFLERNPAALVHGQRRWLLVRLADGRTFRLCKAYRHELQPLLAELASWGLPVET